MKKIILTILILLAIGITVHAGNYDQALIDTWNRRTDLQKAFPGGPYDNAQLEKWAARIGWKENPALYNFYPDKKIIENIVDDKTGVRLQTLENQIKDLTDRIANLEWKQIQPKPATGKWQRYCIRPDIFGYQIKMMSGDTFCGDNVGKPWETIYLLTK